LQRTWNRANDVDPNASWAIAVFMTLLGLAFAGLAAYLYAPLFRHGRM
jgi:hypothetical protein